MKFGPAIIFSQPPSSIKNRTFAISGGSIAGCSAAHLLRQQGANVILFERSLKPHIGRGAGIVLPEPFVAQCIAAGLFDADIPRLPISGRSFLVKDNREIWRQPSFNVSAFNWAHIYQSLRKRLPEEIYHLGETVQSVRQTERSCEIKTSANKAYHVDMLIAADGIDSAVRKQLYPDVVPTYAHYVAWRGVTSVDEAVSQAIFKEHVPYCVYPNGHILFYRIPGADAQSGKILLNWVMYEDKRGQLLSELLVDKHGKQHAVSLPPGSLGAEQVQYLHAFAERVLPSAMAKIICQTEEPFLQAVFDMQVPEYLNQRVCFIGDAASVLRPHTASGVFKALSDSLSLAAALKQGKQLTDALAIWDQAQQAIARQQVALAKNMGEALVTDAPDWQSMGQDQMEEWWKTVMSGKSWYATASKSPGMRS
jgi:2-polyprenyl-6-methoxyphenol hydroxylase-like FAD-dependent oxidoreductase